MTEADFARAAVDVDADVDEADLGAGTPADALTNKGEDMDVAGFAREAGTGPAAVLADGLGEPVEAGAGVVGAAAGSVFAAPGAGVERGAEDDAAGGVEIGADGSEKGLVAGLASAADRRETGDDAGDTGVDEADGAGSAAGAATGFTADLAELFGLAAVSVLAGDPPAASAVAPARETRRVRAGESVRAMDGVDSVERADDVFGDTGSDAVRGAVSAPPRMADRRRGVGNDSGADGAWPTASELCIAGPLDHLAGPEPAQNAPPPLPQSATSGGPMNRFTPVVRPDTRSG